MRYSVATNEDFRRAGVDSPFCANSSGAPKAPSLGDLSLPGCERVEIPGQADVVLIVGALGAGAYGAERKIGARELARFMAFHGLRPEQVVIVDAESGFEHDWTVPAPDPRIYEQATGLRLDRQQIATIHEAAVGPDVALAKKVTICRSMPRGIQYNPTVVLPRLGADLGADSDVEPDVDVVAQAGGDPLNCEAVKSLQEWVKKTAAFAPGQARTVLAKYHVHQELGARKLDVKIGPDEMTKAFEERVAVAELENSKNHFTARVERSLDGDVVPSGRAVLVCSRLPELPPQAWSAWSASRPIIFCGPDPILPFDGAGIDYSGLMLRVRPSDLKNLPRLSKLWLNSRSNADWRQTYADARALYEKATAWPALLAQTLAPK